MSLRKADEAEQNRQGLNSQKRKRAMCRQKQNVLWEQCFEREMSIGRAGIKQAE